MIFKNASIYITLYLWYHQWQRSTGINANITTHVQYGCCRVESNFQNNDFLGTLTRENKQHIV